MSKPVVFHHEYVTSAPQSLHELLLYAVFPEKVVVTHVTDSLVEVFLLDDYQHLKDSMALFMAVVVDDSFEPGTISEYVSPYPKLDVGAGT